jgi:hypothetical protein
LVIFHNIITYSWKKLKNRVELEMEKTKMEEKEKMSLPWAHEQVTFLKEG